MEQEFRTKLEGMQMYELRKLVREQYSLPVSSHDTKDNLIRKIESAMNGSDFGMVARDADAPKPGYTRLLLHKKHGESNRPKIKSINGYRCSIPRGVPVDVPTKVYTSLIDEKEVAYEEDTGEPLDSPSRWRMVYAPREVVQLIAQTPGPDPKPGHELVKAKKNAPRLAYVAQFGYWPTDADLRAAVNNKLIDIRDPKFFSTQASKD